MGDADGRNGTTVGMFDWAYVGVDFDLPGNGGAECVSFLSPTQRLVESGISSLLALFIICKVYPHLTLPSSQRRALTEGESSGKRLLLVLMCLTWGCELGFKFATRQMIWIFNPCHIATAVQIYLLASPPSKAVTAAFRLHMHMLTGAPIAILFPVINTRMLPFETEVYYIQHILMLVIPFYLMHLGDPYIPERLSDFSWASMTFGLLFLYHFIPLQLLAIGTQVNLNNMLCPAVSDPFHGPYYRLFAIAHQTLLIPSLGKIYAALIRRLGWCPMEEEASVADLIKEELASREASMSFSAREKPAARSSSLNEESDVNNKMPVGQPCGSSLGKNLGDGVRNRDMNGGSFSEKEENASKSAKKERPENGSGMVVYIDGKFITLTHSETHSENHRWHFDPSDYDKDNDKGDSTDDDDNYYDYSLNDTSIITNDTDEDIQALFHQLSRRSSRNIDVGGRVTCLDNLEKFRMLAKNRPLQFLIVSEVGGDARLTCHFCEESDKMTEDPEWDALEAAKGMPLLRNRDDIRSPILWYSIRHFGQDVGFRMSEIKPSMHDNEEENRIYVTTGHTLVIKKIELDDAGTYFCQDTRTKDRMIKATILESEVREMMSDKGAFRFLIHLDGVCMVRKRHQNKEVKPWYIDAVLTAQSNGVPCRSSVFHNQLDIGQKNTQYFRADQMFRRSWKKKVKTLNETVGTNIELLCPSDTPPVNSSGDTEFSNCVDGTQHVDRELRETRQQTAQPRDIGKEILEFSKCKRKT
ncbi:hypothetical protein ACOMHN_057778 [Nucella lapillus]